MRSLCLLLLTISFYAHAQSGWTREKGGAFLKTSIQLFQSTQYYNLTGDKLITSKFRQQAIIFYGEYGLSNRLTTIIHFPLYKFNSFETTQIVSGTGDLKIEFKYGILKKNFPLSISIAPEIPVAPKNNYAQNKSNSFEEINLPTGDGEFNIWSTLAGSHSFYPIPLYISASTAYNYRTKFEKSNFRDQL